MNSQEIINSNSSNGHTVCFRQRLLSRHDKHKRRPATFCSKSHNRFQKYVWSIAHTYQLFSDTTIDGRDECFQNMKPSLGVASRFVHLFDGDGMFRMSHGVVVSRKFGGQRKHETLRPAQTKKSPNNKRHTRDAFPDHMNMPWATGPSTRHWQVDEVRRTS